MAEGLIERVERIAEELESLGASFESNVPLKDWLDDNMGVHYTINDDLDVVGVVILVARGGPTIVDTLQRVVRGYRSFDEHSVLDEHSVPLSKELCESIDDWAQDRMERAIASR